MFSFMKYQIFVPKTPNIFAIIPGPPSTIVDWSRLSWYQSRQIFSETHKTDPNPIYISFLQLLFLQNSRGSNPHMGVALAFLHEKQTIQTVLILMVIELRIDNY